MGDAKATNGSIAWTQVRAFLAILLPLVLTMLVGYGAIQARLNEIDRIDARQDAELLLLRTGVTENGLKLARVETTTSHIQLTVDRIEDMLEKRWGGTASAPP